MREVSPSWLAPRTPEGDDVVRLKQALETVLAKIALRGRRVPRSSCWKIVRR
jgi:hypothetical protein